MFSKFRKHKQKENEAVEQVEVRLSKQQVKEKERYLKEIMSQNKLPIVVLDPNWYKVKPLVQNTAILKKEQLVLDYIKEQGSLTNKLKDDNKIKQNLMQEVLRVSQKLGESGDEAKLTEMDKLHHGIVKLNEEIKKGEERLDALQGIIQENNMELLEEAVAIGYEYMEVCKNKSESLGEEIDKLREQMLQKTAEKKKYDEQVNILYHYLHNIVGYKHIDKVDKILGDK